MPDLGALVTLVLGGGGALALALFVVAGFLRGWVVPGYLYDRERARGDRLADANDAMSAAVDRLTDEIRRSR